MERLLFLSLVLALAACGTKDIAKETGQTVDFSFVMDTVRIDAGSHLFFLNDRLSNAGLSKDGTYLYHFNRAEFSLELIDLEELRLERTIPLELEGPNGIGTKWISKIHETDDGELILTDSYQLSVLDKHGVKTFGLRYADHDFEGNMPALEMSVENLTPSKDGKKLLALYTHPEQKLFDSPQGFAVFDLANKKFTYQAKEYFKYLDSYRATLYSDGKPNMSTYAGVHLIFENDSMVFSTTVKNGVNFYDLSTDSLTTKTFSSEYTTQEAQGNYPNRAESEREIDEIVLAKSKEVNYGRFFFDEQNQVYWRFAKEMDRMVGDSVVYKTVLTAFDPDFNQLGEKLLSEDFVLPSKYFVRKGMIYTFLNEEDEVAFVRIIPDFGS